MLRKMMKKGFTLVEMLIVIAIIAVLVSVIIPTVQNSTVKAAAATNAANLRAIEGKIATMRVQDEAVFDSLVDNSALTVQNVLDQMGLDPNLAYFFSNLAKDLVSGLLNVEGSAMSNYANYLVYNHTAQDGVITLSGSLKVTDVPTSKAVSCGALNIGKDVQMTIYITEKNVIASYESATGRYTKEDFAEIAATGKYTGKPEGSGGQTGEDAKEDAKNELKCEILGVHEDVSPFDHACDACGDSVTNNHSDGADSGHVCDADGCTVTTGECTPDSNCTCTQCGATSHVDKTGDTDCSGNPVSDGSCDNCGASV